LNQKKTIPKTSEILFFYLGCHKKTLLMKRRRPFSLEGQLEMADDSVDGCGIFQELKNVIKKIEGSESFKKSVETLSLILTITWLSIIIL
jgi:hypothetical protein